MSLLRQIPLFKWIIWLYKRRKILNEYKGYNIQIGELTEINYSKLGRFNTFYKNVLVLNTEIADYVYVADSTVISNTVIGKFCSIGPGCRIGLGKHPVHLISTFPAFFSVDKQCQFSFVDENSFNEFERIEIGNDVWLGANVVVADGINIGNGAIVAAGAVVVKDVPPYAIVGGVPARIIRYRFSIGEIEVLQKVQWWNKSIDWIKNNHQLFNKPADFFSQVNVTSFK